MAALHYCPYFLWDWGPEDPCERYANEIEQECRDEYGEMDSWDDILLINDNGATIFPNGIRRYTNGSVLYPNGDTAYPSDIAQFGDDTDFNFQN